MNQIFNQSKNKRIIVISFQTLSTVSNSTINVFELFASFKAANALNHWNLSLIQAVQNCMLVGHIDPHVIMLGGNEQYLEIIKLAWMKQILKSPLGFTIQYLGELCNFLVSKTPQCSSSELEEAVCKCICELVNTGLPSNLRYVLRHVAKFLPNTGDSGVNDNEKFLSTEMIKSIVDGLQQKGLVYNTGHGYNVMTTDKLRVAKWLGELPDSRTSFTTAEIEEKRVTQSFQGPPSKFVINGNFSENTDDCVSCYDLRGNKYYATNPVDIKPQTSDHYRTNCADVDNRNTNINPTDTCLNKSRIMCHNFVKKDLPKRPSCVKYESKFINRIICGMKKLRIHWPVKNGVVRSTHINEHNEDPSVINSRLSQSLFAFNQIGGHAPAPLPHSKHLNREACAHAFLPTDARANDRFIPYGETKSISPIGGLPAFGINFTQNDLDHSLILMDEQRCCSELMLTARSSMVTPSMYPMAPLQRPSTCEHTMGLDAPKTRFDRRDEQVAPASLNNRYVSPFTCDSGFNSVHGVALQENETSHSKTSSPPDMHSSKRLSLYNFQQGLYGGPCTWQTNPPNDSTYQSRNYQSAALAPVLESSRNLNK